MRQLASSGSRAGQGTSGSREPQQSQKRRAVPPPPPPPPTAQFLQGMEVRLPKGTGQKTGVTPEGLAWPLLSLRCSRVPEGRGSPTRGLQTVAVDGSTPSLPPIPPILDEGVDGSTLLDIPGLVWDTQLGIAQKGLFPVGGRLSFFLPAWQCITSDQFVLEVIRQGYSWYSLPFVMPPPLSLSPVETPLPKLQCKRLVLWEEVLSLLTKGAVEIVDLSHDRGDFIPITSWLPSPLVGSAPSSTYADSSHLFELPSSAWRP